MLPLVLASASPRRADLLTAAGFRFDVCPVEIDERSAAGELPADYVRRLAREKARRAQELFRLPADRVVLGADTTVVADGEIFGKPRDDDEAAAMLRRLSGRRHDVLTGISVRRGEVELHQTESTAVFMGTLGDQEVRWYVQSGEGRDKAGAYAIQGAASRFIWRIEGSYSNVVGLPVAAVYALIRQLSDKNADIASAR